MFSNVISALNLVVLICTVWFVKHYTEEARKQREVAEQQLRNMREQLERSFMPVVVLEMGQDTHIPQFPHVRNIGTGPAFNVKVADIVQDNSRVYFELIPVLEKDKPHAAVPNTSTNNGTPAKYVKASLEVLDLPDEDITPISITYESISGMRYAAEQSLKYDSLLETVRTTFGRFRQIRS
jgi:hypothetical protein